MVVAATALTGCSKPPVASTEQALLGLTYESVVADLRDPRSVQFSDVVWLDTPEGTSVCGKFNARNGFGGMVGPREFVRRFLPEEIAFARNAVGKRGLEYATLRQAATAALAVHAYDQSKARPSQAPLLYREGDSPDLGAVSNAAIAARCFDGAPATAPPSPLPRADVEGR